LLSTAENGHKAEWHVLWTRSNCERLVSDQLAARGFGTFLPTVETWTRRGATRQAAVLPLFPGYLFLHEALDKSRHVEVLKARGLVRVLGEGWDRLAVVPEDEVDAIRRVVDARVPAVPHPYLREGRRVRIVRGALADVEGILLKVRADKGLLVLSVDLLKRSVAVEVDCTQVVPA
jgi:transcription antitermination factor NusG